MKWITSVFLAVLGCGLAFGQPISNNGNCPQLTRYNAPGGENWGQFPIRPPGFPAGSLQNPLSPQQAVNCVSVPSGLQAQIIASENTPGPGEDFAYFMYFDFDSRGRMWAVDSRDYPGPINSNRSTGGDGRILIFEDNNGDGAMDGYTVFYDGLVIPTSLVVVDGGVAVTVPPYIYYIPDNNGTGGSPQTLFSGMGSSGSFDSHGQTNSLTYGLDNWIYGHTGYNGGCTVSGQNCGNGRTWRFRHTSIGHHQTTFQTWTTGPQNAHGVGMMENGEIFQSGATLSVYSSHSIRRGQASRALVSNNENFYPPTNDLYLWEGSTSGTSRTTAVSGHDFYTARLLPATYNNRLFVCEGATKHCHQDNIALNNGDSWTVNRMTGSSSRIIGSTDAWFAPLKVRTGPDGGLWVADWYNYLFLHNPAQPTISGTGAWQNHLRTKSRTHLYRIIPSNGNTDPYPPMANQSDWVAALGNDNMMWRLAAQKELIYAGYNASVGTALEAVLCDPGNWGSSAIDAMDNTPAITHAVWALEGMDQFNDDPNRWNPYLEALLEHESWVVRRNVLMAMPRTSASAQIANDQCMLNDGHGHVELQADVLFDESSGANGTNCTPTRSSSPPSFCATPVADRSAYYPGRIQFARTGSGMELKPDGNLTSGDLVVYDMQGRIAFRSSYNAESSQWSNPVAKGLGQSIYTYIFTDHEGIAVKGQLTAQLSY